MAVAEYIGFKTTPSLWPATLPPGTGGGGTTLATDTRVFIHGRDYAVKVPQSYAGAWTAETSEYVRVYSLFPDNVYGSSGNWVGRKTYVSKIREWIFAQEILGYPYMDSGALCRKLPVPLGQNSSTWQWQWSDSRGGGSPQTRFTHWATKIIKIEGISEQGQNPDAASGWPIQPGGTDPDEVYRELRFTVMFERTNYEQMLSSDPNFGGEWSRYTVYQEEPQSRFIQIRGGVTWDTNYANYGQPLAANGASGTAFAQDEGLPKLVGENMLTWRWMDVPIGAYNWGRIQSYFGSVHNSGIGFPYSVVSPPSPLPAPFYSWDREVLLLRTAGRMPKNNVAGEPLWDITFYFHSSPATDGKGYWNRILNGKGYYQRYLAAGVGGGNFYVANDFQQLFKP